MAAKVSLVTAPRVAPGRADVQLQPGVVLPVHHAGHQVRRHAGQSTSPVTVIYIEYELICPCAPVGVGGDGGGHGVV